MRGSGKTTEQLRCALAFVREEPIRKVVFVVGSWAMVGYAKNLIAHLAPNEPHLYGRVEVLHTTDEYRVEQRLRGTRDVCAYDHAWYDLTRRCGWCC